MILAMDSAVMNLENQKNALAQGLSDFEHSLVAHKDKYRGLLEGFEADLARVGQPICNTVGHFPASFSHPLSTTL